VVVILRFQAQPHLCLKLVLVNQFHKTAGILKAAVFYVALHNTKISVTTDLDLILCGSKIEQAQPCRQEIFAFTESTVPTDKYM
jgi:hypothetical protein